MKYIFKSILLCTVFHLTGLLAMAQLSVESTHPFVLGATYEIHSTVLNENRTLNIYLPEGYIRNDSTTYPVIYLLDGSADEDFIHIVGLVQFDNFPWIDRLPPTIVVGIANVDRKRDFSWPSKNPDEVATYPTTGHSEKFIEFIENELQPYIQREYNATGQRTIIGQSLGGLLATEILCRKPEMFDQYIIVSPSLWWDNASMLDQSFDLLKKSTAEKSIYIGVGKEGLVPGKNPRVMEVDANILADKLRNLDNERLTIYFDYLPGEDHATILHQAASNAFILLHSKGGQ